MVHTVLLAYTLTKKCSWNAPKITFKCQFKKCMYQKIACVHISLILLSHFYLWGRPLVFLLLAVCHFKKVGYSARALKYYMAIYQRWVNLFVSISVQTDLPNMLCHTVWFDLLIKVELRLKCDLVLISAVITVKVRDLNFSVKNLFFIPLENVPVFSSHSNLLRDWRLHSNVITCMLQSVSNYHKQYQKHQIELLI